MNYNYNKYPATKIDGKIYRGWDDLTKQIAKSLENKQGNVIAVECYVGVDIAEITDAFIKAGIDVTSTAEAFKSVAEVEKMTGRYMTDHVLFGYLSNLRLHEFLDPGKTCALAEKIRNHPTPIAAIGHGASFVVPDADINIYADMPRRELTLRYRKSGTNGLGVNNCSEAVSLKHKRGYFIDWKVCDRRKREITPKVDYWLDTVTYGDPKMISNETFTDGLAKTVKTPFRVVPFFDPAPWGGQWMKKVCNLDPVKSNYGWCFDCVPEENSLLFESEGVIFEMPSVNLVHNHPRALLGEAVEARFGAEFPIRFDFLDTIEGGNLSLQVHPTTEYIKENFGLPYTQDESYYMVDAEQGASVYLGLRNGINKNDMIRDLKCAQEGGMVFDADKYCNKLPAKKHDHFLIPAGTVHCSGSGSMVLEISATPNLFTFKLWDWGRMGLDGKPRPINIDHGSKVIDWGRNSDYVKEHLVNVVRPVAEGDGWREESTGLHRNEFIETRRHWFTKATPHNTNGSVNVICLLEGERCLVKSLNGDFEPFEVHYAETFIIPACVGDYVIEPAGNDKDTTYVTIKAGVRV